MRNRLRGYFGGALSRAGRRDPEGAGSLLPRRRAPPRATGEVTCRDLTDRLDDFVEGRLLAGGRAVFERHLAFCPDCRGYLDSYRKTIAAARDSIAAEALAEGVHELVVAVLDALRRHRR